MLLCDRGSSKGFHSLRVYHLPNYLYGEPPNRMHYPYPPEKILATSYYAYQYAHAWFVCIHTFRQTSSMLAQRHYQEIRPFHTSFNLTVALCIKKSISILSNRRWWSRIGATISIGLNYANFGLVSDHRGWASDSLHSYMANSSFSGGGKHSSGIPKVALHLVEGKTNND